MENPRTKKAITREPEEVLARRRNSSQNGRVEYLVNWKGGQSQEASWEPCVLLSEFKYLVKDFLRKNKPLDSQDSEEVLSSQETVSQETSELDAGNAKSQKVEVATTSSQESPKKKRGRPRLSDKYVTLEKGKLVLKKKRSSDEGTPAVVNANNVAPKPVEAPETKTKSKSSPKNDAIKTSGGVEKKTLKVPNSNRNSSPGSSPNRSPSSSQELGRKRRTVSPNFPVGYFNNKRRYNRKNSLPISLHQAPLEEESITKLIAESQFSGENTENSDGDGIKIGKQGKTGKFKVKKYTQRNLPKIKKTAAKESYQVMSSESDAVEKIDIVVDEAGKVVSPASEAENKEGVRKKVRGAGLKRKIGGKEQTVKKMKLNSGQSIKKKMLKVARRRAEAEVQNGIADPKQVLKVVGRRRSKANNMGKRMVEYLVRWKGQAPEHDTWEECKSGVFRSYIARAMIRQFLADLKASSSDAYAMKAAPVILHEQNGPVSLPNSDPKTIYIQRVLGTVEKKSPSTNVSPSTIKAQHMDMAVVNVQRLQAGMVSKKVGKKAGGIVASKLKDSKAQAIRTLQRKQKGDKLKESKVKTNKIKEDKAKIKADKAKIKEDKARIKEEKQKMKEDKAKLKEDKPKTKEAKTESKSKLKALLEKQTVITETSSLSSGTSSDSGVLYSLPDSTTGGSKTEAIRKRLVLDMQQVDRPESSTGTPDTDPEISFKNSPSKRMLLKDSIRPKSQAVTPDPCEYQGPELITPATPSSLDHPYKTPPSSPGHQAEASSHQTTDAATALAGYLQDAPTSPSSAAYKNTLLKNLTTIQNKKKKGGEESGERRVSVRSSESAFRFKEIVVKKCPGYTQIWLCSQTKAKNALNPRVFGELQQVLHNAKFDDSRVVLLSGSGNTFCSGVDLHYLLEGNRRERARTMAESIKEFTHCLIHYPKPIMVAVNGPAIGLGVALLPLCDVIYASDKASFHCPYARLNQTPEGAASFTFPSTMGTAMANELLLGGRRLTAIEANQAGLVSQVFWPTSLMQEVIPRVHTMAATSGKALEMSKMLLRGQHKVKLQLSNESECAVLAERWPAPDSQAAIRAYIDQEQDLFA